VIHNAVGKPVEGDDFFNRQKEIDEIWSRLATDDILLLAPRRVGKTSLMYRLRELAPARGFEALYVSVADASTELAFARKLLAEIGQHKSKRRILSWLKKSPVARFLSRVRRVGIPVFELEIGDEADGQWAAIGESIVSALRSTDSHWLLLIDEMPIFVLSLLRADPAGGRARDFLNWFRTLRQHSTAGKNVRWLLAGSIGLDTVARRMDLGDTINDLFLYSDFGAFDRETASALLDQLALAYNVSLSSEVKRHICDRTGWLIPFHLQLCFSELRSHPKPSTADVDAVFDDLLSPSKKTYFDFWRQRLHQELGAPDDGRTVKLLNAVAADDTGASKATLQGVLAAEIVDAETRDRHLGYLVDVLVSDGYLVHRDGRYVFRSNLLRDYWRRYVV
jgi:AAA+ ATPase superfamily predicted ATPase